MSKHLDYNATLLERRDLSEGLARFLVEPDAAPPASARWFEPGQYVSLGLNLEESADAHSVQRAYSIASEPEERRWLEFYIRLAAPGNTAYPFTHRLWAANAGSRLHVSPKITGHFALERLVPHDDPRIRILIGSGTGLAPFVSAVRSAARRGDRAFLERSAVLHGASHAHELGYRDEIEAACAAGLRLYLPTVSRPRDNPSWTGATGRVESWFEGDKLAELERRLGVPARGLSPRTAAAFVCGFTGTIIGVVSSLVARGFAPEDRKVRRQLEIPPDHPPSLFWEQYDPGSILDSGGPELVARLREAFHRGAAGQAVE